MNKSIRQRIEALENTTSLDRLCDWEPVVMIRKGGPTTHAVNTKTGEVSHDSELLDGLFKYLNKTGCEIHVEMTKRGGV
jgi:hypothetical protein